MKVVFDTNIFVSAFTLPGGWAAQALEKIIDGHDSLAISRPIIEELLGVLARKFAQDREQLARTAVFLSSLAEIVEPSVEIDALSDTPDNRILECAVAVNAGLIVTGDRAMPAPGTYGDIRIVTLGDYLSPTC